MQLETFAVNAVTTAATLSLQKAEIPIGDKGISFDGHIDVIKDSFLGKVPVQVKGTGEEKFSTRSFSLELEHFRNFSRQAKFLKKVSFTLSTCEQNL
ncbi:MAG: hypothetical protein ABS939_03075 [Psychrobacillus sp.]